MNVYVFILLFIISIYILNSKTKKKIYEGFEESSNDTKIDDTKIDDTDDFETCNYRESKLFGKMCNEKWGKPDCNKWEKKDNLKILENSKKQNVLRGYHSNDFMYEIDYKNNNIYNIEKKNAKLDLDIPRGVHSSFFT